MDGFIDTEPEHIKFNDLDEFNPKIISDNFKSWYNNVFPKINKLLSEYIVENDEDCHNFWVKNVYLIYFIYMQLQNNNHINFSFREGDSSHTTKLQRKYVHILNNVLLQLFPNYEVTPTRKINKKKWNDGYQSDEYDEVSGTWDNKSYETGPCYNIWTMCYILLVLKEKRKYNNKVVYAISFVKNNIIVSKI
jgi:hypothetical protein